MTSLPSRARHEWVGSALTDQEWEVMGDALTKALDTNEAELLYLQGGAGIAMLPDVVVKEMQDAGRMTQAELDIAVPYERNDGRVVWTWDLGSEMVERILGSGPHQLRDGQHRTQWVAHIGEHLLH